MYSIYRLKANKLDIKFIEGLKKIFKGKDLEIVIYDVDETEYLTQSPENKKRLLEAIDNVNKRKNLVSINIEDL